MKISDAYPSAYIKAADLQGRAITVTISDCRLEHFDDESKPLLLFVGASKGLLLNKTNAGTLADAFGDETDDWRGRVVELYPARVMFGGRMVDAIRLRVPTTAPAPDPGTHAPARSAPAGMRPELAASMAVQAPAPEAGASDDPLPF